MKNPEIPSTEQVEALKTWAAIYGRNWKSALRDAWMNGDYNGFADSHLLQQVRNTFGLLSVEALATWFPLPLALRSTKRL